MIIPINELDPDTLKNIVESFVLREGTDYGDYEGGLNEKVEQVLNQLKRGEAVLLFSEEHETVDIRLAKDLD
jgi:uncharacterized protein YheU (UPF0270 family)